MQDTIHIATKLKTRILKPDVNMQIGKYTVSKEHLRSLIEHYSKDKHFLNRSYLDGKFLFVRLIYFFLLKANSGKLCYLKYKIFGFTEICVTTLVHCFLPIKLLTYLSIVFTTDLWFLLWSSMYSLKLFASLFAILLLEKKLRKKTLWLLFFL